MMKVAVSSPPISPSFNISLRSKNDLMQKPKVTRFFHGSPPLQGAHNRLLLHHCQAHDNHQDNSPSINVASRRNSLFNQAFGILLGFGVSTPNVGPALALPGFKKDLTSKRRVIIPIEAFSDGPEGLKYFDVIKGTGAEAKVGSRVAIHFDCKYKGVTFITTRQGEGVTGGNPFGFDVGNKPGQGGTLRGLDLGVRGMLVGGQRRLIVPPSLAYGDKGVGEVPPNATLTIDVQLLSIKTSPLGSRVKLVEG